MSEGSPQIRPVVASRPCATMDEVRAEIDRLDRLLVPLIAERLAYVAQAARHKPTRADVVVPWRIEEVVAKVRECAMAIGADADTIEQIWRSLMAISIDWEAWHFDRREARPSGR
ncbi:chorismate mutase [Pararhodospirillum photometricum]|nr:chorismate mutase [Pararhodospirillum photometricum]